MQILFISLAVLFTSLGQISYKKYANSQKNFYLTLTISLFLIVPIMNFSALKYTSLDIVYMSTSITIVISLILSRFLLKEKATKKQLLSSLLITLGIIIYNS
ncbi:EamA family transporter [Flammeovirga sp. EKP202]|uniref:EamA family transporter n=1 Tax=Flammeovirga sp. EKP202 TaxID=2770592 RepID=UPI00165F65E3|nr:EamA family transporter [Flammeovirga sp. EKP202]